MHMAPGPARPGRLLPLVAVLAIALAACASGSTPVSSTGASPSAAGSAAASGASSASAAVGGMAVTMKNLSFAPTSLTVAVGSTVTWTNQDSVTHTVTANDGSFDSSVSAGSTFSQTFSKAGTFAYHCKIHSSMTATVIVH